jgi:glutathione S-transferase
MAGDSFTMADIPVACDIHRWFGLALPPKTPETPEAPVTSRSHAHLERWYAAVSARPAAQPVLALPLS